MFCVNISDMTDFYIPKYHYFIGLKKILYLIECNLLVFISKNK